MGTSIPVSRKPVSFYSAQFRAANVPPKLWGSLLNLHDGIAEFMKWYKIDKNPLR